MEDDFPPREPPRFWIAVSIFVATLALIVFMLVYTTVRAEAQDQAICAPADILFKQFGEVVKEKIIWEGTMKLEQGALQFVLFQGEKGNWSLFVVQDGIACLRARGDGGTPNDLGKGV
jgi:hypothetical protein